MCLSKFISKKRAVILCVACVVLIALCVNAFAVYIPSVSVKAFLKSPPEDKTVVGEVITDMQIFVLADQPDYLCEVDTYTGCIQITDKAGGQIFSSNPTLEQAIRYAVPGKTAADEENDEYKEHGEDEHEENQEDEHKELDTSNETVNRLMSQLVIEHINDSGDIFMLNSFENCVAEGNLKAYKTNKGIRLMYEFGKTKLVREDILIYFPEQEFDDMLESLPEEIEKAFDALYAYNFDDMIYVANRQFKESDIKKVYDQLISMGYTDERIAADNTKHGVIARSGKISITIPVDITFGNGVLTVQIPMSEVIVNSTVAVKLANISLLEQFGAALPGTEGYMMIPNGSGALTYFKKDFPDACLPYNEEVYGKNPNESDYMDKQKGIGIKLPVYGIKKGNSAFISIIEQGDAIAAIHADGPRLDALYKIWSIFEVTKYDLISYGTGAAKMYDRNKASDITYSGDIKLSYHFLSGEDADYSGMARVYGDILQEKMQKQKTSQDQDTEIVLEFLGAIDKIKPMFGVPVSKLIPLTTTKQLQASVDDLINRGVSNPSIIYNGWFGGGVRHHQSKRSAVDSVIGGKYGMTMLVRYLNEKGVNFYPEISILTPYYDEGLLFKELSCAKSIDGDVFRQQGFDPVTHIMDLSRPITYLLSPVKIPTIAGYISKTAKDIGFSGLTLRDLGNTLYNDERKNGQTRAETKQIIEGTLSQNFKDHKLLIKSPSAYAFLESDIIVDTPIGGDGYAIIDESIPFYQIALHGIKYMTSMPLNLGKPYTKQLLDMVETGAIPYFILAYTNQQELMMSKYTDYYSVNFNDWNAQIAELYETYLPIYRQIKDERIKSHVRTEKGLSITTYDNGNIMLVNHSNKPIIYNNYNIVDAETYMLVKEAG